MERTFSYRRQEVVQDKPLVADFKSRWPALFEMNEVRLGNTGRQDTAVNEWGLMRDPGQSDDIEVRRECILKCLCTYLHEDSGKLVGEYLSSDIAEAKKEIAKTVMSSEKREWISQKSLRTSELP
ncbi:hypothetical protein NQZ68_028924 [Dissostichus eleginoides]|nr:hypothetical protein NQZ68_028924 [Dissostichus eleginoides]